MKTKKSIKERFKIAIEAIKWELLDVRYLIAAIFLTGFILGAIVF